MKEFYGEEENRKEITEENKGNIQEKTQLHLSIEEEQEINSIDYIYDQAGYNKITYKNIFLTFFVLSVEGLHFTLFSNMIIPLKAYYKMTEDQVRICSSMLFLFVGIGSFLSGKFAGKFGRPILISFLLFVISFLNILMALSTVWWVFLICRCLIGLSAGFVIPMSLNLLTEYLPLKLRSFVLTSVWCGFNFGALVLCFIMIFIMPNLEPARVNTTILLSAILPFFAFLLNLFLLQDSPRNLILRKLEKEAFEILEVISKRKFDQSVKIKILQESNKSFQNVKFEIKDLFGEKFGKLSLLLTYIWFFNSILSYGPGVISNLTMQAIGKEQNISNLDIIKNQIVINLIGFFSLFLGGIMTEASYLGRKLATNINFFTCLAFILLLIAWPGQFAVFFGIYSAVQGIAFNISTTYSCEVYPTKMRDHAIGFLFSCTRVGGFISQILYLYLNSIGTWIPYYASSIFLVINIILVFLLPYDTHGMPLDKEITRSS